MRPALSSNIHPHKQALYSRKYEPFLLQILLPHKICRDTKVGL